MSERSAPVSAWGIFPLTLYQHIGTLRMREVATRRKVSFPKLTTSDKRPSAFLHAQICPWRRDRVRGRGVEIGFLS